MRIIETETIEKEEAPYKTAEEMEEICCVPVQQLQCKETWEIWDGYTDEEILEKLGIKLDEDGKNADGYEVEIRRKPRKNPCGYKVK